MTIKEIENIINKGEGISVEFKLAKHGLPQSVFETVCAFLNRDGGNIFMGIDDTSEVKGVEPDTADKMCKEIAGVSNNSNKINPCFLLHPTIINYKSKVIIRIFVPASSQVHRCDGKIFDRSIDGDFEVKTDEQIRNIYLRKNSFYTESTIYPYLQASDFAPGIVEKSRKIIRYSNRFVDFISFCPCCEPNKYPNINLSFKQSYSNR